VKEEVAVKKDAEERTEKVSDKVRHTEVKVEDERGNAVQSGNRKAG
jgi:stress response protein YsnF